jgi:hypothetical protein
LNIFFEIKTCKNLYEIALIGNTHLDKYLLRASLLISWARQLNSKLRLIEIVGSRSEFGAKKVERSHSAARAGVRAGASWRYRGAIDLLQDRLWCSWD